MVHRVTKDDYEALLELNKVCYPEDTDPTTDTRLLRVLNRNPCWVYNDNGVKACLLSEISQDQPYIWSICTAPSHRGKGIAKLLLAEFENHYLTAGYNRPWLHVRVNNPAQKLYFDTGYRVNYFVPNVYGAGQHGLTMMKRLD